MTRTTMTTTRQRTRRTNRRTAAVNRIHRGRRTPNRTEASPPDKLSSAELSQESRELCHCANPALLPPPGGASAPPHPPLSHSLCVADFSRFSSHGGGGPRPSCPKTKTSLHSLPDMTVTWQQGLLMSRQKQKYPASHWFGDVTSICVSYFDPALPV